MDADASLRIVGEYGCLQITNYIIFGLGMTLSSLQVNSVAFTIDQAQDYHCKPHNGFTADDTSPLIEKDGELVYDGCAMYELFNETLTENTTTSCQYGWEYPNGAISLVTELDLVCSRGVLAGTLMSVHFAGFLVGCGLTGQASDMFGRRTVSMVTLFVMGVLGTIVTFIRSYEVMLILRFFLGLVMPGNTLVVFVRAIEMFTSRYRLHGNMFIEYFWSFGSIALAPLAYGLSNWRHLQLVMSLACFPLFLIHWFFSYESVRWLVQKGRLAQAERILRKIAKSKNIQHDGDFLQPPETENISLADDTMTKSDEDPTDHSDAFVPAEDGKARHEIDEKVGKKYTFLDLFKTRTLIKNTLIIFVCWFVINTLYFGFLVYSTSLAGNKYLNFFLLALVEIPEYIVTFFIMKRFGRRKPLILFFCAAAVSCYMVGFLPVKTAAGTNLTALIVVSAVVGKFFASAVYDVVLLYGAELFPTVLRNIATGSSATIGKTSTLLCPFIILLKDVVSYLPMTIFGTLSLIAATCVYFLPETKGRRLPEAYGDAYKFKRHQEMYRIGRCAC